MRKRREKRAQARSKLASAPPEPVSRPPTGLPFAAGALMLLAAALALYWGTLRYPLVFDDYHLAEHTLKTHHAGAMARQGTRWLSDASFWWIYSVFGKDLLWQRLANVVLHAATATLLFGFLARLFETVLAGQMRGQPSRWVAFFAAALFLLHPVAVYGVAYLVERSIILAALFSVTALWCVLEGLLRGSGRWAWAAAAAYLLAVSSKEHAVMVPAVAVALGILVRGPSLELARRMALPLLLLSMIALVTVLRMRGLIGTAYEPFASDVLRAPGASHSLADIAVSYPLSILNQATLFFRYLATWLLPWPGWMSVDIRTSFPHEIVGPHAAGFAAWLVYGGAAAWLLSRRGFAGLLGFGLLYPWLLALAEMSAVRAQEPFVLYRSYLWMSGLPAIVPAAVLWIAPRWRTAMLGTACALLVIPAYDRLQTFSSPLKLWDDALRKNDPAAPLAERAYVARGLVHLDAKRLDAAGNDIAQALAMNRNWPDAWLARGSLHLRSGRLMEARADLDRAIALDPAYASAYDKRCVTVTGLEGPARALADCEKAVQLDPRNHEAWINVGAVYHSLQRPADALRSFERALEIVPSDGSAHYNYGVLLLDMGRRDLVVRRHIEIGCDSGIPSACEILRRSRVDPR